jgi:hypothetical protein
MKGIGFKTLTCFLCFVALAEDLISCVLGLLVRYFLFCTVSCKLIS